MTKPALKIDLSISLEEQFKNEPLKSSGLTEADIIKFIFNNDDGVTSFTGNCTYTANKVSFEFTYGNRPEITINIFECTSKKHPNAHHIEVVDRSINKVGGIGSVSDVLITLRQIANGTHLVRSDHNSYPHGRVAKFFHNSLPGNRVSLPHLRIKYTYGPLGRLIQVMKKCPGIELWDYVQDKIKSLDDSKKAQLCYAILYAYYVQVLRYDLLHRDIKLDNIMIDDSVWPPIINFIDNDFVIQKDAKDKFVCGEESYLAPEIWDEVLKNPTSYSYTEASEIFSLGRVLAIIIGVNIESYDGKRDGYDDKEWLKLATVDLGIGLQDQAYKDKLIPIVTKMLSDNPSDRGELLNIISNMINSFPELLLSMPPNLENDEKYAGIKL